MKPRLLTWRYLDLKPKLLASIGDIRRCPGTRDHERGLLVDSDDDCFRAIEERTKPPAPKKKPRLPVPGDVIGWMIQRAGFTPVSGCGCEAFKQWMNAAGWWVCLRERKKIVDWFCEKAKDAGVEVSTTTALALLVAGVREIRKQPRYAKRLSE